MRRHAIRHLGPEGASGDPSESSEPGHTEASNLLRQIGDPNRSLPTIGLMAYLRALKDSLVASATAMEHAEYASLGPTDAAILSVLEPAMTLLTADESRHGAALRRRRVAALFRPAWRRP